MDIKEPKFSKYFESTQQQAVASWVNYLNQLRLDQLMQGLQDINDNYDLTGAMKIINSTMKQINKEIIEKNRGAATGMHGFIAECAEVGVNNAWLKYSREIPIYKWINDDGPADIQKGVILIQQKFYNSGNGLSLNAVRKHLQTYPDFLKNGGKYQIPRDQFEKIKYLLDMPADVANKMPTSDGSFSLKQWKNVHDFFGQGDVTLDDFEESRLDYKSVQKGAIHKTLNKEKAMIKQSHQKLKDAVYEKSMPTLHEGLVASGVSAAVEGGTAFGIAIVKKTKSGKKIQEFSSEDWQDILKDTGLGSVKGGVRGASIYVLTNFTATPAAVASSIVTASFGIANQANLLRKGMITEDEFIQNSQTLCVETSVSALSSFIGQAVIPVPVLGAVIGNTVGTLMYQIAKDNLSKYEQNLIKKYKGEIEELNRSLEKEYRNFIKDLVKDLEVYYELLDSAFSPDYQAAFEGSIALALNVGVPYDKVLKNLEETDDFFLG